MCSYLLKKSNKRFPFSPGFSQWIVDPLVDCGTGQGCPVCTHSPWSLGKGAEGCRWCSQLGAGVEVSRSSLGSPRPHCPHCPARTLPGRSGGCPPGCSCCVSLCGLLVFSSERKLKQSVGGMVIKRGWHNLCWGRSCWSTAGDPHHPKHRGNSCDLLLSHVFSFIWSVA